MAQITFELFMDDDRYSVPTLHLVTAADPAAAVAIAERLLAESPHHLGADICLGGERLARVGAQIAHRAPRDRAAI